MRLALGLLLIAACGSAPAATPVMPVVANSADATAATRSDQGPIDFTGEWYDEVGTLFVFEPDGAGGVTLVRGALQRGDGDELTDLASGWDDAGQFWLRYSPSSDTVVTISVIKFEDGFATCTWDNGDSHGDGALYRTDDPRGAARGDDDAP